MAARLAPDHPVAVCGAHAIPRGAVLGRGGDRCQLS
eukprot:CAMPEP_0182803302 /NCGR_PEP_ID=MMETSP0006_2-20121128/3957_1 /TAXON_ID=97485 /ORGANISM="Prymnesium parvum, Strain Texoma1" /LENGTH=35 /DNA_ID= /DNA_START= /DNA_END= /DNA_ORIENTATION=